MRRSLWPTSIACMIVSISDLRRSVTAASSLDPATLTSTVTSRRLSDDTCRSISCLRSNRSQSGSQPSSSRALVESAEQYVAEQMYDCEDDVGASDHVGDKAGDGAVWTWFSLGFAGHMTSS